VRLAFAVAAFLEPEILVIDEVLAVGDVEFQKKAIGKMQDISRGEGRTVLFVSHNMSAIKKLCTRGIVLEKGSVAFEGDADEAVSFYLSNQNSIGSKVVLADRKDRIGNGQFRFKTITFFNSKNEQVNEIMSGEEITIHFEITKYIVIDYAKLIVSIAFQDINMNTVALLSSDELKSDFSNLTTSNSFSLKIPQFLLRGGKYSIRIVSTYKTTHVENFIDNKRSCRNRCSTK
jgi:lipopolysaccharide transport system ATP-binding protein